MGLHAYDPNHMRKGGDLGEYTSGDRVPVTGEWKCKCRLVSYHERHACFPPCKRCGQPYRKLVRAA